MDSSLPGSSVHEILQARILEWGSHSLLQGIFPTPGSNLGLLHCRQILYCLSHQRSPWFPGLGTGLGWGVMKSHKQLSPVISITVQGKAVIHCESTRQLYHGDLVGLAWLEISYYLYSQRLLSWLFEWISRDQFIHQKGKKSCIDFFKESPLYNSTVKPDFEHLKSKKYLWHFF